MSDIEFAILLRKPKYPVIIVSADQLYSAFNIKQLAKGCISSVPLKEETSVKAIDSTGEEFWYSIDNYALSPGFLGKIWTKKQIIEMYNSSQGIFNTEKVFSLKSLSSKKVNAIIGELCERLKK